MKSLNLPISFFSGKASSSSSESAQNSSTLGQLFVLVKGLGFKDLRPNLERGWGIWKLSWSQKLKIKYWHYYAVVKDMKRDLHELLVK